MRLNVWARHAKKRGAAGGVAKVSSVKGSGSKSEGNVLLATGMER
jgi:hypothetical protein